MRTERTPGLDYILAAMARANMFQLSVGQNAPTADQAVTAWLKPAIPSWVAEGVVFLWSAAATEYQVATPALWSALFLAAAVAEVIQDVTTAGPVTINTNSTIVRVQNVGAAVALVMPPAATMLGPVLISDWANLAGTNNISIARSGSDVFPNGATTWTIAGDGGSVFLRPVPGGFAL